MEIVATLAMVTIIMCTVVIVVACFWAITNVVKTID